jgi:acetyltransferase-like isoleucine patch superfamily enzyme
MVGGNHRIDWVTSYPLREMYGLPGAYTDNPWSKGDIVIGHGATLGQGAKVLSGVKIGDGAIVGPFSVVTDDVRPYALVGGNPGRELARRFEDEIVNRLLEIRWWTWPPAQIEADLQRLTGADLGKFLPGLGRAERAEERHGVGMSRAWRLVERVLRPTAGPAVGSSPEESGEGTWSVAVGRASYGRPTLPTGVGGRVVIGSYTSIAEDCEVVHDLIRAVRPPVPRVHNQAGRDPSTADVHIGSDVWLARGSKIMAGCTIGHGAVVGAYAVVTGDVAPYAIVAGNPAQEVGHRFDGATAAAMLRIRWWDWPEERLVEAWPDLCTADVARFVAAHDPLRP